MNRYIITKTGRELVDCETEIRIIAGEKFFAHQVRGTTLWKVSHFETGFSAMNGEQTESAYSAWACATYNILRSAENEKLPDIIKKATMYCLGEGCYPVNREGEI